MKKVKVFQRISDFESFINSPKVDILSYDVKAVVKSEVNRDGFLASVFYDEKEFDEELVDPKNSKIESPPSLDEQMQHLEQALEIFIQNFVYGECQLCITDMAQLFNTHTQRIRDVFFELFKKRKIKYNTETINLFEGRYLEFAIVKGKDSLMFNHNTEFKDVIANEINSIAQSGMDEFQKDMKPYLAAKPRVIKFFPADVDYKVDCMVKLTFSKSYK
jgi:hypothetical protein